MNEKDRHLETAKNALIDYAKTFSREERPSKIRVEIFTQPSKEEGEGFFVHWDSAVYHPEEDDKETRVLKKPKEPPKRRPFVLVALVALLIFVGTYWFWISLVS